MKHEHAGRPRNKDVIQFDEDLDEIERVAADSTSDLIARRRAGILMDSNTDMTNAVIADGNSVSSYMVAYWRKRYLKDGAKCIYGRRGRPKQFTHDDYQRVVEVLVTQKREDGGRWTLTSLAQRVGISKSQIGRLFRQKKIRTSDSKEEILRKWNVELPPKNVSAPPADEHVRRSDDHTPSR
jgi:hypothetical protein